MSSYGLTMAETFLLPYLHYLLVSVEFHIWMRLQTER